MCYRLGCPFQDVRKPPDDDYMRILIFGATGMTGTAVLSAALTCIWFKVFIFTRRMNGPGMEEMLKKPLAGVVEGDMFNYETVLEAMKGKDAVFLSTTYWDTMRVDCEFDQGCNVVKAAMAAGIKHLVYVGTPYCSLYAVEKCKYLLGKEKVEAHIVASGIPYTILHLGFYYENFLSVFRPHMVERNKFALALPMGNVPLNCGSVLDFGQCIAKIMLRPAQNIFKTIKLATGYHTVAELAFALDDHFANLTFYDPKIPLTVYRGFDFKGSQDLATMFGYFQSIDKPWPQSVAIGLYGGCRTFKEWIGEQETVLLEVMFEDLGAVYRTDWALTKSGLKDIPPIFVEEKAKKYDNESGKRVPSVLDYISTATENSMVRKIFNYFNSPKRSQRNIRDSDVDIVPKGLKINENKLCLTRMAHSQMFDAENKLDIKRQSALQKVATEHKLSMDTENQYLEIQGLEVQTQALRSPGPTPRVTSPSHSCYSSVCTSNVPPRTSLP